MLGVLVARRAPSLALICATAPVLTLVLLEGLPVVALSLVRMPCTILLLLLGLGRRAGYRSRNILRGLVNVEVLLDGLRDRLDLRA